jgi:hypothetical protein
MSRVIVEEYLCEEQKKGTIWTPALSGTRTCNACFAAAQRS